jgi:hypothetical protein
LAPFAFLSDAEAVAQSIETTAVWYVSEFEHLENNPIELLFDSSGGDNPWHKDELASVAETLTEPCLTEVHNPGFLLG